MSDKPGPQDSASAGFSLRRWSRRKLDAARETQTAAAVAAPPTVEALAVAPPATTVAPPAAELPPIESLTLDSDFTVFFQPQVDEALKRAALKQLFRDPRFNIMDGLDIYVGDYTKSDPIPDHIIQQLVQARAIFNPRKTMLTPEGYVVDVPEEDTALPAATEQAAIAAPATATPVDIAAAATVAPVERSAIETHTTDAALSPAAYASGSAPVKS
jgi:hypothetical protein